MNIKKATLATIFLHILLQSSAQAMLPGDATQDFNINGTPSIVDVFDMMVWANYAFSCDATVLQGDFTMEGCVDVADRNVLTDGNGTLFTKDPVPSCAGICVDDATYFSRLQNVNGLSLDTSGMAPEFTLVSMPGMPQELWVEIQPNTTLLNFTVTGPEPTSLAPIFQMSGLFPGPSVATAYFDGRQQWTSSSLEDPLSGFAPNGSTLVATYPSGSFVGQPAIFYQINQGIGQRVQGQQIITGTFNVVPEPAGLFHLVGAVGLSLIHI